MVRRSRPGDLHVKVAFVHRQSPFQNSSCNRTRNLAAMSGRALHHHDHHIFRIVVGRETSEPGDVFLVAMFGGLRSSGFAGNLNSFQAGAAAGAAIFVHDFPQTLSNDFHLGGRYFASEIRSDSRREIHWLPFVIADGSAVLIQNLVDESRVITGAAICRRGIGHRQLQRRDQGVALSDRYVRRLR